MDKEDFRDRVKKRLNIDSSNTEFDSDIEDFVEESVAELYPVAQGDADPVEVSIGMYDIQFELPEPIRDVRRIEYQSGGVWLPYQGDWQHHDNKIILDEHFGNSMTLKIYGTKRYEVEEVPAEFHKVVINWAISEFYSMVVGNKRKYNIYAQSSGARGVDSMRDLSDYYQDRGNQILMDRTNIRGQ